MNRNILQVLNFHMMLIWHHRYRLEAPASVNRIIFSFIGILANTHNFRLKQTTSLLALTAVQLEKDTRTAYEILSYHF